jgi:uncharacterized protein
MRRTGTTRDRYILAIDGGGIRGIIPVMILQEIERILSGMGYSGGAASLFDLFAGTSTGGLISLALASPAERLDLDLPEAAVPEKYSLKITPSRIAPTQIRDMYALRFMANKQLEGSIEPEPEPEPDPLEAASPLPVPEAPQLSFLQRLKEVLRPHEETQELRQTLDLNKLLEIYASRGAEIFPRSAFRQLQSLSQVFSEKYSERSLEQLLQQIFTDLPMHDAQRPVLVVTYDCLSGRPYIISSFGNDRYLMRDAARATSAAPTYFSPLTISPLNREHEAHCLIDGGVAANNPSLIAYLEARKLYPEARHYHILSLGTASKRFSLTKDQAVRGGVIGWMDPARGAPLYKVMRSSQSALTDHTLNGLSEVSYHRIEGTLQHRQIRLDDASEEHIRLLKQTGREIIAEHADELHAFCRDYLSNQ